MNRRIAGFIEKHSMLDGVTGLLLGLSGGADSVCLFHILREICGEKKITLYCAHINHNLRENAKTDEGFVKELCGEYGVKLFVKSADIAALCKEKKIGTELCARQVRYEFFKECMEQTGCQKTVTAHNKNDSAETQLFNLARGSGIRGLCGIKPVRGEIIRPLLCCGAEEIREYCRENGWQYREDESNKERIYSRNIIRHDVLPKLRDINSNVIDNMTDFAEICTADEEYFDKIVAEALFKYGWDGTGIDTRLKNEHESIKRRAIIKMCGALSLLRIKEIQELLDTGHTGQRIQIKEDFYAYISYGVLCLGNLPRRKKTNEQMRIEFGENIFLGKCIRLVKSCDGFDLDKLEGVVTACTRSEGDKITLAGGTKSIKRLMIDKKIPAGERDSLIILKDVQGIIYIEKIGAAKRIAANGTTKNFFKISINYKVPELY